MITGPAAGTEKSRVEEIMRRCNVSGDVTVYPMDSGDREGHGLDETPEVNGFVVEGDDIEIFYGVNPDESIRFVTDFSNDGDDEEDDNDDLDDDDDWDDDEDDLDDDEDDDELEDEDDEDEDEDDD